MMLWSGWLYVEGLVFALICVYCCNAAYRNGICDGAFNHFLPGVRAEMRVYDEHRAREILQNTYGDDPGAEDVR